MKDELQSQEIYCFESSGPVFPDGTRRARSCQKRDATLKDWREIERGTYPMNETRSRRFRVDLARLIGSRWLSTYWPCFP